MNIFVRALPFLFLPLLTVGCGQSEADDPSDGDLSSGGEDGSLPLDVFADALGRRAGDELCGDEDAPLRGCFLVTEHECRDLISQAFRECANEARAELPAYVDENEQQSVGETIGLCAGTAYHHALAASGRLRDEPECQS